MPSGAHAGDTEGRGGRPGPCGRQPAGAWGQETEAQSKAPGQWGYLEAGPAAGPPGAPLHLRWPPSPPPCSAPSTCSGLRTSAALFTGCHAHHRETCVNGNISEDEWLLKSGGNVVHYPSASLRSRAVSHLQISPRPSWETCLPRFLAQGGKHLSPSKPVLVAGEWRQRPLTLIQLTREQRGVELRGST